jgi:hypothetical protein
MWCTLGKQSPAERSAKMFLILPDGDHGSFGKGHEYFAAVQNSLQKYQL